MERRRRFLLRELLLRCDLMITARKPFPSDPHLTLRHGLPPSIPKTPAACVLFSHRQRKEVRDPREYQWIRRYLRNGVNLDLPKRADLINNFIKWSGPPHESGLLTV